MVCDQSPPVVKSPSGQVRFADRILDHVNNVLQTRRLLNMAPAVGHDMIQLFERNPEIAVFDIYIDHSYEQGDDGIIETYKVEFIDAISKTGKVIEPIGRHLCRLFNENDSQYLSFGSHVSDTYMLCSDRFVILRSTYDRLKAEGNLTPMEMYKESAKERYETLCAEMQEPLSLAHSLPWERPRQAVG